MLRLFSFLVACLPVMATAQSINDSTHINSRYFEDQFYLGITYNFLLNQPENVEQQNLSYGLQGGFIKDIPLNTDRTIGFGLGVGLGLNTYYSNIRSREQLGTVQYSLIDEGQIYKRSKFETHSVELPVEFRWRNSNAAEYKFWRIYTGVKFAYVYDMRSKFVPDDQAEIGVDSFANPNARKLQYGLTFNFGYNSFNAHIYYALTNLLDDNAILGSESIKMKPLRIGLIFYIL